MKSTLRITTIIGIVIICLSCFCAPVYLFIDCYFLPKLYLFTLGIFIYLASLFLLETKVENNEFQSDYLTLFYLVFIIMSECECAYVIINITKYGHNAIGEFGTFDNPAGLALTLSIALSMIIILLFKNNKQYIKFILFIGSIPIVSILLMTNSRTGLICFTLNILILLWLITRRIFKGKIAISFFFTTTVILLTSVALYVTSNKSDSTTGRIFILKQSFNIIKKRPIIGYGPDGFRREYMLQQANYFRENSNTIYENNADDVRHPMNEFVYLWINYGIGGPILLASLFLLPFIIIKFRKEEKIIETLLPLVTVILFCFFSYPLHYQSSWLVFLLVLSPILLHYIRVTITIPFIIRIYSVCLIGLFLILYLSIDIYYEYQWCMTEKLSFRGYHKEALIRYGELNGYLNNNIFFLYSYATSAFMGGDMQKAHKVIKESGRHWNGYDRELLSGDICFYLNEYEEALEHFREAHYMCPVRFAPLEGLYKVYKQTDNEFKKDSIAKIIANKSVKVKSNDVERIKETCN